MSNRKNDWTWNPISVTLGDHYVEKGFERDYEWIIF